LFALLIVISAAARLAQAQDLRPLPATLPVQFESWQPVLAFDSSSTVPALRLATASQDRGDRALLGGAIGAAAGVVSCTVISTLMNDSAEGGLSFCPLDTYLLFAGGGFVLGAFIGWVL
jgi:hypothetical protein